MVESSTNHYAFLIKQTEISNRLENIIIGNVRKDNENDFTALEKLTEWINELTPMACIKYRKKEEKVRFQTKATSGTNWGPQVQKRTLLELFLRRVPAALYISVRELNNF